MCPARERETSAGHTESSVYIYTYMQNRNELITMVVSRGIDTGEERLRARKTWW